MSDVGRSMFDVSFSGAWVLVFLNTSRCNDSTFLTILHAQAVKLPAMPPRLVLIATFLVALRASATTYFVSTTGADSNSGAFTNAPWRTIQHAANTLVPGDTAQVRGGV